ncbi:MAG: O-antigen ligase family protein [Planctomycetes bacterium]|nr:O-antigen ligase family protein [Planctomycetota bacterium]MBL7037654.1 O-antigen ligase family protein [Pirellulaceae bacterium]
MTSTCIHEPRIAASGWQDSLRSGIWPRSVVLWMTVFWLALFIIRPGEMLFPKLAEWHAERLWAIATISAVMAFGMLRLCPSLQTYAVLLFLAALTLSSICSLDGSAAWVELYKYIVLVVSYFVLLSAIRTPYQLVFVVTCYVAITAAYLGKSEYEYFVHGAGAYMMGVKRLIGLDTDYGHPNAVAASSVLALPLVHFLWDARQYFTRTWPQIWRCLFPPALVAFVLLAIPAIVLTNSRSGMLGFVVFVFLTAVSRKTHRARIVGLVCMGLLLVAVWAAMPQDSKDRLRTLWDPSAGPSNAHESAMGRIEGMMAGLMMFERFPVTGVGIGNFIPYRVANVDGVPLDPHNLLGEMLGETGVLGTGAFLLVLAAMMVNCRRTAALAKQGSDADQQMLSRLTEACVHTVLLLLFFGLFSHNLLRFNWLWLAAFALHCRMFSEQICLASQESSDMCVHQHDRHMRSDGA